MKKIITIAIFVLFIGLIFTPNISAENIQLKIMDSDTSHQGLVLIGSDGGDWSYFTSNAQSWYYKWCDRMQSGNLDSNAISDRIRNQGTTIFYVIAHSHGQSNRFLAQDGDYYTADMLRQDMMDREPITFALICCCQGMTDTGPGSLSYEFRKGQTTGTVTVGYQNFDEYAASGGSMWTALDWQDLLLNNINRGYTIKKAFDKACNAYSGIADYVKFVGDTTLKLKDTGGVSTEKTKEKTLPIFTNIKQKILSIVEKIIEKLPILNILLKANSNF